jgi:hypothetical protein
LSPFGPRSADSPLFFARLARYDALRR